MPEFKRIYIEITNICNLSCSFCPKLQREPYEMSKEEFSHISSLLRPYCDYIYLHVKGEPLAHSEFDKILTICDRENYKVNITTNGTLIEKQLGVLKSHKCVRQLNISLHSMENPEKALKYVNSIVKSVDILKDYFMISLRVWTADNKNSCNDIIIGQLEKHYNVKVDLSEKRSVLSKNIFFSKGETFEWPSPLLPDYGGKGYCLGTRSQIAVLSDGTVVPCCLDAEGLVSFGN